MDHHRLKHDVCWAWATAGIEPVAHMLNQSEQRELHAILYEQAQQALLYFEEHAERQCRRLTPTPSPN